MLADFQRDRVPFKFMQEVLNSFFARRQPLLDELAASGERLDALYEELKAGEPSMGQLATLEGVLAERRSLLDRLMRLDDELLDQLVRERTNGQKGETNGSD